MPMRFTEERLVPASLRADLTLERLLLAQHLERYRLAKALIERDRGNGRILDIACGTGYGASILSEIGDVVAVDRDDDTVAYARREYPGRGIRYLRGDAEDPAFLSRLGGFHAVVSFETLEHLSDPDPFLRWVQRSLLPGGQFICSVPVTKTLDLTPYHTRDYDEATIRRLLRSHGFDTRVAARQAAGFTARDLLEEWRARRGALGRSAAGLIRFYCGRPRYLLHRIFRYLLEGRVTIRTAVLVSTAPRASPGCLPASDSDDKIVLSASGL
jgi:SAM-dependent methyltransferase